MKNRTPKYSVAPVRRMKAVTLSIILHIKSDISIVNGMQRVDNIIELDEIYPNRTQPHNENISKITKRYLAFNHENIKY